MTTFRILLVDDNTTKLTRIREEIDASFGAEALELVVAGSSSEAIRALQEGMFDLLVLDLFLPPRPGTDARKDGGRVMLNAITRGAAGINRPGRIIGLTAYDECRSEMESAFASEGIQIIKYDDADQSWSQAIANVLAYERSVSSEAFGCDACIITALKDPELSALLRLPGNWKAKQIDRDDSLYWQGAFKAKSKTVSVFAANAPEMGLASSTCMAMKMVQEFRPRLLIMCGIAAGIDLNFGDIVIADQCFDYGCGKIATNNDGEREFVPSPFYYSIAAPLKDKINTFISRNPQLLDSVRSEWPANRPDTALKAVVSPIATGSAVVENTAQISEIRRIHRKVSAVEMEGCAVFAAARASRSPRPEPLLVKSISDRGVPPKTDEYRTYAAYTSARFVFEWLCDL
jgi:nucleoside phosphorylase